MNKLFLKSVIILISLGLWASCEDDSASSDSSKNDSLVGDYFVCTQAAVDGQIPDDCEAIEDDGMRIGKDGKSYPVDSSGDHKRSEAGHEYWVEDAYGTWEMNGDKLIISYEKNGEDLTITVTDEGNGIIHYVPENDESAYMGKYTLGTVVEH